MKDSYIIVDTAGATNQRPWPVYYFLAASGEWTENLEEAAVYPGEAEARGAAMYEDGSPRVRLFSWAFAAKIFQRMLQREHEQAFTSGANKSS